MKAVAAWLHSSKTSVWQRNRSARENWKVHARHGFAAERIDHRAAHRSDEGLRLQRQVPEVEVFVFTNLERAEDFRDVSRLAGRRNRIGADWQQPGRIEVKAKTTIGVGELKAEELTNVGA